MNFYIFILSTVINMYHYLLSYLNNFNIHAYKQKHKAKLVLINIQVFNKILN